MYSQSKKFYCGLAGYPKCPRSHVAACSPRPCAPASLYTNFLPGAETSLGSLCLALLNFLQLTAVLLWWHDDLVLQLEPCSGASAPNTSWPYTSRKSVLCPHHPMLVALGFPRSPVHWCQYPDCHLPLIQSPVTYIQDTPSNLFLVWFLPHSQVPSFCCESLWCQERSAVPSASPGREQIPVLSDH